MLNILNIFPPSLILLMLTLVIIPTAIAILLRKSLYRYLIDSANKVSRLLSYETRGKQPQIVENLEARFKQASLKLEQVNTIALIDGLYSQEKLNFLGISLRCEQWDFFCQTLPNLLLAFGLLGTFFGISANLYNLSQTINQNTTDLDNLIEQLQIPLQNMGIAFSTSLAAILCSSILIILNLRYNTNFAKSLLISSLEDYLDNIFKINVQGDTRLDKAVDRMVKQQQEFLERFHVKVGEVLETTIGNAASKMVAANQGFQNNVDSLVNRFNDISSSIATGTNSFQESAFTLKEQIQTVNKIVPTFETAANKIESSSQKYLQAAEKIEASKFSAHLENLTADLANTQKAFSQSTAFLGNQVQKITDNYQQVTELAQQVYTQLQTTSNKLESSAVGFIEAAEIFKQTDFADKLTTATTELVNIPQQFNQSTAILHQSTDALGKTIDNINIFTQQTNSLIEQVNKLNHKSSQLLEKSEHNIQQEITSLENIKSELHSVVTNLSEHKKQVNIGLMNFGEKIFTSFEKQTENNIIELKKITSGINNNLNSLQQNYSIIAKLIKNLEDYQNNFQSINSKIASRAEQQEKQRNSDQQGIVMMSERLFTSFEQRSQNNTQEIMKLTAELKQIANQINNLIKVIK
ncbi:hypothetical protein NIES4102_09720 [Chondrocystis sp. NIES-4102]|nr:hypothetical protein NIES4102_09720 [Chondrocystis sp. NIES-4102]